MKDGYLDDVFDVLDAHAHPCVLIWSLCLAMDGRGSSAGLGEYTVLFSVAAH